ncbi:MAG: hypothetical protein FWE15_00415 [Actinomycetia bacterium]|nr:hypothetical protein [Actinomycetes bacterium]
MAPLAGIRPPQIPSPRRSGEAYAALRRNIGRARSAARGDENPPARQRIEVPTPAGFPAGTTCDVVETSAEHGLRILDCLPTSGCVLADGDQWSWIVPAGSDIDVEWPSITRYLAGAAVLVPAYGPRAGGADGRGGLRLPDRHVPYTHPILLYFAVCGIAGTQPSMTVK